MAAPFLAVWYSHGLADKTLKEIADEKVLATLCPDWWRPEGRLLTEAEDAARHAAVIQYVRTVRGEKYVHAIEDGLAKVRADRVERDRKREIEQIRATAAGNVHFILTGQPR